MRQNLGGRAAPFAGRDRAAKLMEKAEKSCLVSRPMKTLIRLEPEIVVK